MSAEVIALKPRDRKTWGPVLDGKGRPIAGFLMHTPSGVIYFRKQFRKLGIPALFRSTGETTIGRAKTQAALLQQQHVNKYLGIDDSHALLKRKEKTFGEVADLVLGEHTPKQRIGTQKNHALYVGELKKHWGDLDVNAVTVEVFESLISRLRRTKKRRTYFDLQKAANLVMRKAYEKKWTTHLVRFPDPDKEYRLKIENKAREDRPLTREESEILDLRKSRLITTHEMERLWEVMNDDTRDQFVLAFDCIMRLREGLRLTWSRCDVRTGLITLRKEDVKTGSKTGKGRSFYMAPRALERMRARYERRNPRSPYVFPSPNDEKRPVNQNKTAWRLAKDRAGIKGRCRWHDLRHTALTFKLLGDPSLPMEERIAMRKQPLLVSEYAGVSMRTIQAVYLKTDPEATREVSEPVKLV